MKQIRTQKGKLYGTLDLINYILHIKDGVNTRRIQVPPGGLTLQFIAGNGQAETIAIPPRTRRNN